MVKKNIKEERQVENKNKLIEENTKKVSRDMFMEYAPYLIIILFVIVIRIFIATPVKVNGTSMDPTLKNGDTMILYKLTKKVRGIKRFDIVVIKTDSGKLIKRVIGLPKDKIRYEVKENEDKKLVGKLYINDKVVEEKFISEKAAAETCADDWRLCKEEIIVPEGEYFVMGDNRFNSKDSRMLGTIPSKDILGTTELILLPLDRIGKAK